MNSKFSKSFENIRIVKQDVPKGFICQICGNLMKEPIQTFRGNTACSECYFQALERSNGVCPIDNEEILRDEVFRDKAKEKEILNLNCYCPNENKGCNWHGSIRDLMQHNCDYEQATCSFCGKEMMPKDLTIHQTTKCPTLVRVGPCHYQNIGCTFKANSKEEMAEHLKHNQDAHSACQNNYNNYNKLKEKFENVEKDNQKLKKSVDDLEQKLKDSQKQTMLQIQTLTQSLSQLTKKLENQRNTSSDNLNFGGVIDELQIATSTNTANISDVDLRLQLHENTINNGHLIWKIDNFQKRRNDAVTGKITALHSAPCFTNQYGYKFCLRLYLNGDGMGKGTHVSLFLVIMRSEYDNLLQWPFTKKVKFTLINQQNQSLDIVERMAPNKESSSFQKPKKEMNIASGCPLFVSLEQLDKGFLKDDSLFVDVEIM